VFHDTQEIGPINYVKSLRNIQLNEEGGHFLLMQLFDHFLHIYEVVIYTPFLDEGSLVAREQIIQLRF
jgi:hypothetical protein